MNHRSTYNPMSHGLPLEDIEVRAAHDGDAAEIAHIDTEWIDSPVEEMTDRIRSHLGRIARGESSDYSCVALVAAHIVGYGKCAYVDWPQRGLPQLPPAWYLTGVTVARQFRRRRIGTKILEHRLDWLKGHTGEVYYFTGEANRVSQDLHSQLGFVETGVRFKNPKGNLPDEWNLLYHKTLAE